MDTPLDWLHSSRLVPAAAALTSMLPCRTLWCGRETCTLWTSLSPTLSS